MSGPAEGGGFEGRTAIVTGSGRGIGRTIAESLAADGANVVVTARSADEVEEAAREIRSETAGDAVGVPADVSEPDDVDYLFAKASEEFGGLDVLVNNAAVFWPFDVFEDSLSAFRQQLAVNLDGAVYCALRAAELFAENEAEPERVTGRAGRIVNISSIHTGFSEPTALAYDVSKAGLDAMTRSLSVELAPHDVLVNSVAPGFVETSMSVVDGENELEADWFQDYYVDQRKIPQARAAQPEEIAAVVRFLSSPENTYTTGQTIYVDGGLSSTF